MIEKPRKRRRLLVGSLAVIVLFSAGWATALYTESPAAANPLHTLQREHSSFEGRIEQHLGAGSYSYLALRDANDQQQWVVTMGKGAPVGARVRVRGIGVKSEFHSRRLHRTFPRLVFAMVTRVE